MERLRYSIHPLVQYLHRNLCCLLDRRPGMLWVHGPGQRADGLPAWRARAPGMDSPVCESDGVFPAGLQARPGHPDAERGLPASVVAGAGSALPHALPVDRVDGRGRPVRGGRRDDPHRHLPGAGVPRRSAGGPPLLHASRPHARLPGERSAAEDCRGGARDVRRNFWGPGFVLCSFLVIGVGACSCMLTDRFAYSLVRITW
mmetsp:Transcript_35172/g.94233  ORF Transcript_35172/g.94233 Transcript_35172/m.94233 type:complete len:202 (-) Transcript_35172:216-821(-)